MVRLVPREANHLSSSMRVSNAAVMHYNHLGLPVRGLRRSQQFYSASGVCTQADRSSVANGVRTGHSRKWPSA